MSSVRNFGSLSFCNCKQLTDLDLALNCIIGDDVFFNCPKLTKINLVGGIHKTVASLHLERWRNEMKGEINRINEILPNTTSSQKTAEIQEWMRAVISRLDHYKAEHNALLKEATTLLELALWKAKIEENEGDSLGDVMAKRATIDVKSKRSERRITSGANIVIKNALPFLELN